MPYFQAGLLVMPLSWLEQVRQSNGFPSLAPSGRGGIRGRPRSIVESVVENDAKVALEAVSFGAVWLIDVDVESKTEAEFNVDFVVAVNLGALSEKRDSSMSLMIRSSFI